MPIGGEILQSDRSQVIDGLKNFASPAALKVAGQFAKTHFLVVDRDLLDPPVSPTEGAHYLLPATGTLLNAWSGFTNGNIAAYSSGAWQEIAAVSGFSVFVADEGVTLIRESAGWVIVAGRYADGGTVPASSGVVTLKPGHLHTLTAGDTITGFDLPLDRSWAAFERPASGAAITLTHGGSPGSGYALDLGGDNLVLEPAVDVGVYIATRVGSVIRISGGGKASVTATGTGTVSLPLKTHLSLQRTPQLYGAIGDGDGIGGGTVDKTALGLAMPDVFIRAERLNGLGRTYRLGSGAGLAPSLSGVKTAWLSDCVIDLSEINGTSTLGTYTTENMGLLLQGADIWAGGYEVGTLASGSARFSDTLTLQSGDGAKFAAGDVVLISNTSAWGATGAFGTPKGADSHIVKSVSGDTVVLEGPLLMAFGTGATVRKYPNVEVILENVRFIGGGAGLSQAACWIGNVRRAIINDTVARKCENRGVAIANCWSVEVGQHRSELCDKAGLGYGFGINGVHRLLADEILAENCRYSLATGTGLGTSIINRVIDVDGVYAYGATDGSINAHPGTDRFIIGHAYATCQQQASGFGSGSNISAANIDIDRFEAFGFWQHGLQCQPTGSGDGVNASHRFGYVKCEGDTSTSQEGYGLLWIDDAAVGAFNMDEVVFERVEVKAKNGAVIRAKENTVERLTIGGGAIIASTANDHTLRVQCGANGRIKTVNISHTYMYNPGGASSKSPFYANGISGQVIDDVTLVNNTYEGGDYGARFDYATVGEIGHRYVSNATGSRLVGTGATWASLGGTSGPSLDTAQTWTGLNQFKAPSSSAALDSTGNGVTNLVGRIGAGNVGAAGFGIDFNTSNVDGKTQMQARSWNDYSVNVELWLQAIGGDLKLAASGGKIGFFGTTPITKPALGAALGTISGAYSQSEVQAIADRVNTIRTTLINLGLTS